MNKGESNDGDLIKRYFVSLAEPHSLLASLRLPEYRAAGEKNIKTNSKEQKAL
jgi:hypothetical protein